MRHLVRVLPPLLAVLVVIGVGLYVLRRPLFNLMGQQVGVRPPTGDPAQVDLTLPEGFASTLYAEGLSGPRFMTVGPDGTLFVAERGRSRIVALPDRDGDGRADEIISVVEDLDRPSSMVFRPGTSELYIGETSRVTRVRLDGLAVLERTVVIPGLPTGRVHYTTTVLFNEAGDQLFVSIGSSCNVCNEGEPHLATVWVYAADGSGGRPYTVGLRNAVGLARQPETGQIWASNNGRDLLGNELPPETVYILEDGGDAGWPRCHAGDIVDPEFGSSGACDGVVPPAVELQAHSAPLGLTFYEGSLFPADYEGDLFIAFHGSWNRNPPTGYKVVRVPMADGQVAGEAEDFATGWLLPNLDSVGRPVDVTVAADGALLVSDDKAGLVYRIAPTR